MKCFSPATKSLVSKSSKGSSGSYGKYRNKNFKPTLSEKSEKLSQNRRSEKNIFKALHDEKRSMQDER